MSMAANIASADDIRAVSAGLYRYARALDERDWALLDDVFAPDANAHYGADASLQGREAIVAGIRRYLDHCGPTQHMVTNIEASPAGERLESRCCVQAAHTSVERDRHFAVLGRYVARWIQVAGAWRIADFRMSVDLSHGDPDILFGQDER